MRSSNHTRKPLTPIRRQTLAEEVLDRLVEFIASGDEPTQQLLPEHALCERLGVSRGALREALAGLGHLGIVETHGKSRIASTVAARAHLLRRAVDTEGLHEGVVHAMEARMLLEPPLARLAADRVTPQSLRTIQQFLELMEQAPDGPELMVDYDSGFHVSIARSTGNPTLVHMVSAIADALAATRKLSLHAPGGTQKSIAGHHAIVNALRARDPARTESAMRAHLQDVTELIDIPRGTNFAP
ncbi:MAG: FCD domain-containing protein [Actinomycetota bacterium]|nr:FCD domain-containing protein [Actinomycetota bacterium]